MHVQIALVCRKAFSNKIAFEIGWYAMLHTRYTHFSLHH